VQEIERSAASVEEAIEVALEELGLTEQEARVEIVQEPRSGFLGIASQPAVVRVKALVSPTPEGGPDEDQPEVVASFVDGLMAALGLDVDVEINEAEGTTYVDVWGAASDEGMGLVIGKRGHTLDAIQELARSYVHHETGERCLVMVDVEDYRKRRRSQIIRTARDAARRVKRTGQQESLEPMSAYERKLVHDAVAALGGLETSSEGEEPGRRVVIRRAKHAGAG
jgi:spoIIIJ-associated protein